MAVTRLERKGRTNKARAGERKAAIKRLSATPVIKKVDIEELKAEFSGDKSEKKEEAPAAE